VRDVNAFWRWAARAWRIEKVPRSTVTTDERTDAL
jgi:hypothetical protein